MGEMQNTFVPKYHIKDPKFKRRPLCGALAYSSKNFLVAQDENEITCSRCLKKLGAGRFSDQKKLYDNFQDWFLDYIQDPVSKSDNLRASLKEAFYAGAQAKTSEAVL